MELIEASSAVEGIATGGASVSGAASLSAMERIFCDTFVANGGNGTDAAIAAGYAEGSAHVTGCRLLCRKRVADHLVAMSQRFVHAALPVAIRTLIEAASDDKALWKDRIKAAVSLLEHGGMAAPKGGVHVNVGVAVDGAKAQQLISSVWSARAERMSDIPTAMPDNLQAISDAIDELESDELPAEGEGGEQFQGPVAGVASLPPPSPARSSKSGFSCECEKCRAMDGVAGDGAQ